jgi:hypothetical protein
VKIFSNDGRIHSIVSLTSVDTTLLRPLLLVPERLAEVIAQRLAPLLAQLAAKMGKRIGNLRGKDGLELGVGHLGHGSFPAGCHWTYRLHSLTLAGSRSIV